MCFNLKQEYRRDRQTERLSDRQVNQTDRQIRQTSKSGVSSDSPLMMDDYTLPFWIYLGVLTVFVGGAMKKILASHLSTAPPLVAWLGATVLVERLWAFCLPAVLLLVLLGLACCLYSATRTYPPPTALPAHGKAVLITGKKRLLPLSQVCVDCRPQKHFYFRMLSSFIPRK